MKIQTFSIVVGTSACNAHCPYCISKMTGIKGFCNVSPINWRNFDKACLLAKTSGVSSVIITGKGEPTLYPDQITQYLKKLMPFQFPIVELQTNGIVFGKNFSQYKAYLDTWWKLGLTFVSLSIVHYDPEKNRQIYLPEEKKYINIGRLIDQLHQLGYSVRLSCTLLKKFIDSPKEVNQMVLTARKWQVDQLSLRPVAVPNVCENDQVCRWTKKAVLDEENLSRIKVFLDSQGHKLASFGHGAVIYDINDQNVCLTNALTIKPVTEEIRQSIFLPNGRLSFDWQYKGAVII